MSGYNAFDPSNQSGMSWNDSLKIASSPGFQSTFSDYSSAGDKSSGGGFGGAFS